MRSEAVWVITRNNESLLFKLGEKSFHHSLIVNFVVIALVKVGHNCVH